MARDINKYLASIEKNGIAKIWIDDIINPELVDINAHEKRILASSYTSEDGGRFFVNYKISIETRANTIRESSGYITFNIWNLGRM